MVAGVNFWVRLPLLEYMATTARDLRLNRPRKRDLESRFVLINRDRLQRVCDSLSPRQQEFLELLPLLFHLNHALLPGYVSQSTPCGIADYSPSRPAVLAAKRLAKTFGFETRLQQKLAVRGLYLMGSPGTIAYSKTSDLDIWLCHDSELADVEINKLEYKARLIERFAQSLGLEIHFFVFDAERFKRGETLSLSAESSGSSQHYLLLDEFYRSGLLLAGLKPMWWYVPPEEEHRYDEFVADAIRKRLISPRHYVDFGGLGRVPTDEFFGAAVWHLYKSIESPYKSAMKLLLMETYAAEYPNTSLLSHGYKRAIGVEDIKLNDLDPYIAMYRKVEEYLMANNDSARLKLLRRCFYLKANEPLSVAADPRQPAWRRELLEFMTRSWGWLTADILFLDGRSAWRIDTAIEERRELIKALQRSYAGLSEFARTYANDKKITEADLNVLGRKLYAAFDRKPGKIDIITRGICTDPAEQHLSLHQISTEQQRESWLLYDGIVAADDVAQRTPLRRAPALIELLVWCHFNRLAADGTQWHIHAQTSRIAHPQVRKILEVMNEYHPNGEIVAAEHAALGRPARVVEALFFINTGVDPLNGTMQDGDVLTSNRTDAFQFGGRRVNLVQTIDLVLLTSWEEVFSFHYTGAEGLLAAIHEYLQWAVPVGQTAIAPARVYCLASDYAHTISQRVEKYINDACRFLATRGRKGSAHYLVQIDERFHQLISDQGVPAYRSHANHAALLKFLAEPRSNFLQVGFDQNCAVATPLATLYGVNKSGTIQVFAGSTRAQRIDLYILDEHGALFTQRQEATDIHAVFDHLTRFFENTRRHEATRGSATGPTTATPIEFYQLQRTQGAQLHLRRISVARSEKAQYLPIRMFADLDAHGRPQFTVFCGEREFSTAEHGAGLFAKIAAYVLANRRQRLAYPVYITDLELSTRVRQQQKAAGQQTIHLLNFKRRFEYQLTQALRRDAAGTAAPS